MASISFIDSLDGGSSVFDPGVGTVAPAVASPIQSAPVVGVVECYARARLIVPPPVQPGVSRRTRPIVVISADKPAILQGQAVEPKWWGQSGASGRGISGIGHFRPYPDPDPVWDGTTWVVPPPPAPAGAHFMQFSVKTLPDPSSFPNARYLLGTADSRDGTSGINPACTLWESSPGSWVHTPWLSKYPFKPTVQNHIHYGTDGTSYTEAAGIHFDSGLATSLWMDWGSFLTPPFTLLVVALVANFPSASSLNYILDSGDDPTQHLTSAQELAIYQGGVQSPIALSTDPTGYRSAIRAGRTQLEGFTDPIPTTRIGRVAFNHTLRPKVMALVNNGAASMLYSRDPISKATKTFGLINRGSQRLMTMGRANGVIDHRQASDMIMFEMRAWDAALTLEQLDGQYNALSTTWKFASYTG